MRCHLLVHGSKMPASTYPDLVVSYPPAQRYSHSRLSAVSGSRCRSEVGAASSLALRPAAPSSLQPHPAPPRCASSPSLCSQSALLLVDRDLAKSPSQRSTSVLSATAPTLPSVVGPAKATNADLLKEFRRHPIQCGHPPTRKTTFADLELPVSMAQDPKWSTDLQQMGHALGKHFRMNDFTTAGFMAMPCEIDIVDGRRQLRRRYE
mmetsp:Transcript_73920/g.154049  ORF Transcript_73920/g.154049 Transcript_73920/m.154049 type:complete len:207 (+) Transcript_73920:32-652(+)